MIPDCKNIYFSSVATVARVQQLWNEWEIQGLVLVSFSLQVFLLFSAGFRKRYSSRALRVLLWLAYLSADSVVVFVLGRLTLLLGDDPHHQLVLFWVPFLLLHLGGQDTITAFSMEDCALWKRHLLNLITQVAMAIYVVGKQWRWDKQLVAPMVLMFISGTTKYAERTWALWRAGSRELETKEHFSFEKYNKTEDLLLMFSSEEKNVNPGRIVKAAVGTDAFRRSMEFTMDVTPKKFVSGYWDTERKEAIEKIVKRFTSSDNGADLAYKLCEIRLSLIYDYLYTKFGSLKGVLHRLTTLVLTSSALAFFVVAMAHSKGSNRSYYSGVDVWISYVLLVGALALEISSILMWLMSSFWPYMTVFPHEAPEIRCARRTLLSILKRLRPRPESRVEWSGKLHQYSLIDECIHDKMARPVNFLAYMTKQGYTAKHVVVSAEVKKVLLDKLCEIATSPGSLEKLAFSGSFRGEWAAGWAASSSGSNAAQKALVASNIQNIDLVSSAVLWHLVTEKCLEETTTTFSCRFRTCSQQLSNYVMYLLAHCKVMLDSDGRSTLQEYRIRIHVENHGMKPVQRFRINHVGNHMFPSVLDKVRRLPEADKWELIAMVWVEMLCYIARNCGPEFHAKQLSAGGEFLTHAKLLIFLLF